MKSEQLLRIVKRYDYGASLESDGAEVVMRCPFHASTKRKLYANAKRGFFICFRCDARGTVNGLLVTLKTKFPSKFDGVAISDDNKFYSDDPTKPVAPRLQLPPEFLSFSDVKDEITHELWGRKALKYLHRRGITDDLIELYRLGYAVFGPMAYRVVIPVYENNELVYYMGRDFTGQLEKKVYNPPKPLGGVGSHDVVFGLDIASRFEEAVVCEGVFDAMSVRPPIGPIGSGVALFGKSMSETQFNKLLHSGIKKITLLLDQDAKIDLFKLARRFTDAGQDGFKKGFPKIVIALLPEGDPNTMRDRLDRVSMHEVSNATDLQHLLLSKI